MEVCGWNIVRILGKRNAERTTLNSISNSKGKDCPYVDNVGEDLLKRMWSGEQMQSFGLNSARSLLGKNVNLHLKDGSVIVNVQVDAIQKDDLQKQKFVRCIPYGASEMLRVPLKTIAWAERLNLNLIRA